ncbi:SMP-30/gluconolactonase/LRE family protein [Kordiimonas lipolytica]|uniref:SMP-30/gluconolactonase/LRE family protein n=1 Tax=Kordiimonas lipolytica TaxID=1662421 RepID=A0ABV8UB07_9PROT|nr:SMP-30/gluconolactonase/LRE family protein [Kordiimonas lipolytica]
MRKFIIRGAAVVVALLLLFILWPAKIDPIAYTPPEGPGFEGVYATNDELLGAETILLQISRGPEDVAVDGEGRIYGGLHDGQIIRILHDGTQEVFATIEGGRPLGLHFDAAGNLIVADAWKGLLSFDKDGKMTVLSTEEGGVPFAFADDLDIASDGKIYFSDASDTYSQPDYRLDLLEARGNGRLLVFDPATGETTKLLGDLYFANGIALSQNEDFVLVNETGRYRVTRYWLKGDKAGTSDIFIDNLPGFPDGISASRKGTFWLAIPSPRNPMMDNLHPKPWAKALVSKLPTFMQPSAIHMGMVIALDEQGNVIRTLQDPMGSNVYMITSAEQVGDMLYLGSLEAPQVVRIRVGD